MNGNSAVDEIKNRLDIVEVIGSYIKLQKTGANYRANCPFHSEKKPSFFVSPARQIWHCFGCGLGGDVFKFVMQIEGVEFGDALRILARRAGVELKPLTPEYKQWQTLKQRLYEINELACCFFEKQLKESKAGQAAKQYLLNRGINEESIKKWRLGYAPDTWQGLLEFLTSQGYSEAEVIKAGLAIKREESPNFQFPTSHFQSYDRFRGRIIFPIFDLNSQVIGFGGRVFKQKDKEEVAKYINTPETPLYDKSQVLYGLDKAKMAIREKDACILVEGYTDVIMAHQIGTLNTVATSGTALTPQQLKILKRYTENLLLGFDMDVAGESATKRGIDLAQMQGFNIKILRLAGGKDAAEIIAQNPSEWLEALNQPKSIMDFYFESAFAGRDAKTAEGKKQISRILLPVIKRVPDKIEQNHWIKELARRFNVKEEVIEGELAKIKEGEYPEIWGIEPEEVKNLPVKSRKELLEERLVVLLLKSPQNFALVTPEEINRFSEPIKEILLNFEKRDKIDSEVYNYLALRAEIEEMAEEAIVSEIKACLKELALIEINNQLDQISQQIKKAEEEENWSKVEELTKLFNELLKQKQKCQE